MIQSLGPSPTAVAAFLASVGAVGTRRSSDDCAVARYLHAVIGVEPYVKRVTVWDSEVRVTRRGLRLPAVVALPAAVTAFIRAFDAGCFPELIDGHLQAGEHLPHLES